VLGNFLNIRIASDSESNPNIGSLLNFTKRLFLWIKIWRAREDSNSQPPDP